MRGDNDSLSYDEEQGQKDELDENGYYAHDVGMKVAYSYDDSSDNGDLDGGYSYDDSKEVEEAMPMEAREDSEEEEIDYQCHCPCDLQEGKVRMYPLADELADLEERDEDGVVYLCVTVDDSVQYKMNDLAYCDEMCYGSDSEDEEESWDEYGAYAEDDQYVMSEDSEDSLYSSESSDSQEEVWMMQQESMDVDYGKTEEESEEEVGVDDECHCPCTIHKSGLPGVGMYIISGEDNHHSPFMCVPQEESAEYKMNDIASCDEGCFDSADRKSVV